MKRAALILASLCLAAPAAAQQPRPEAAPMSLEQTMLLRCSAVFALVAGDQQRGVQAALAYPPLAERGREFFVRAGARLMDERHLSREQLEAAMRAEVAALQDSSAKSADPARFIDGVMQPCLGALEVSGL